MNRETDTLIIGAGLASLASATVDLPTFPHFCRDAPTPKVRISFLLYVYLLYNLHVYDHEIDLDNR